MRNTPEELSALTPPAPAPVPDAAPARRARTVGVGRAHAKTILLGEHAVVYGAPALALPVPQLAVTASAGWSAPGPGGSGGVSLTMTGSPSRPVATEASEGLRQLAAEFRATVDVAQDVHLEVILDCAIPPGRGLGSSAACARAVVLALADLFGREVSARTVFDLVQSAENVAHGRASGVDATAVGAPGPLLFQQGTAQDLEVGCEGLFIVADSGEVGRTKDAVTRLREGFTRHPGSRHHFLRRAALLTDRARQALAQDTPDALGPYLTAYHHLLREARLSTERIDALVEAALAAGSLGAKITGGGLGGCMIALVPSDQAGTVTRRLHAAGAQQTWVLPLTARPDTHPA
ncbi:mevalonate kinase [Streptomyces venezuelae]|uniref:mevalonate kinase n=1 Tax=Streptomyces venezuelae TaxID=54571 RepID=A0A5P2B3U7_STRVZ|nr:mevalonate kinase [Streptomyces venezuelae]QES25153.1 mevalonate kinase [Streptomyces venezuelae]